MTGTTKRGFGSDNHAGVHPAYLQAIANATSGHQPAYGTDSFCADCSEIFRRHFGAGAEIFFVFNGTAANVLSFAPWLRPFESIICTDVAHLHVDECAAPERNLGAKLMPLPHREGKLRIEDIERCLIRGGDQHFAQPRAISITQPTELGTVYLLAELRELTEFARSRNLLVHMDGARLPNAVHSLDTDFQTMTQGIDVLSFGGTKNGFLFGEAVVFLNSALARDFKFYRKQLLQLASKQRFIAAQFIAMLSGGLWRELAAHVNRLAHLLADELRTVPALQICYPVQSNAVFVKLPRSWVKALREHSFFYIWDEHECIARLMTSFDTTESDIRAFAQRIRQL